MQKKRVLGLNFIKENRDNIFISKKALSQVVVTLIIIVLVLFAMGIIWNLVNNVLQEGTEDIENSFGEILVNLNLENVLVEEDGNVSLSVKRGAGGGEIVGLNFIFSDGSSSEIIREDIVLNELGERRFTFTLTEINVEDLETVSVAPIYSSSGRETEGDVSATFNFRTNSTSESSGSGGTGTGQVVSNFESLGFTGTGEVVYDSISFAEPVLPEFRRAVVNPLDVLPGDNQTFTVDVYSPHGVVNVTSFTELDNSNSTLIFERINETTNEENETVETWSVTWNVTDVHTTTYRTHITAVDSEGNENTYSISWTDSCQSSIVHDGGPDTISGTCSTGKDIDGGKQGGGTLTITGSVTINSGSIWKFDTIQMSGSGSITVQGTMTKSGNLYFTDNDGDGYPSSRTVNHGSGDLLATSATGDGAIVDCYDSNSNARPGQTSYFTSHRGDGSYDYNCDNGVITKQTTATGGSCRTCQFIGGEGCVAVSFGGIGYSGSSSPACGSSGTYYSSAGTCPLAAPSGSCFQNGCSFSSVTQACR